MFIYQSRFLTRGEVWFDDEPNGARVDWILHRQKSHPIARATDKHTVLLDLTKSPVQLWSEMNAKTVKHIEEAERTDHTRWEPCDSTDPGVLDAVERMWNESAGSRKSAPLERDWLERLNEAGALSISATKDEAGNVLTYHLCYVGKDRAQGLIGVSPRNAIPNKASRMKINRAHTLGYWKIILFMKERGLRQFDFGGWYAGKTDIALLGINAFKEGFGGQVVREYDCCQVRTVRGWVVLRVAALLDHAKRLAARFRSRRVRPMGNGRDLRTVNSNSRGTGAALGVAHDH